MRKEHLGTSPLRSIIRICNVFARDIEVHVDNPLLITEFGNALKRHGQKIQVRKDDDGEFILVWKRIPKEKRPTHEELMACWRENHKDETEG